MVLLSEQRLTLSDLAKQESVNMSTCWRWSLRGVRGVKLKTFSVGARRFTTREAFARFVEATTAVANGESATPRSETNRQTAARATRTESGLVGHGV